MPRNRDTDWADDIQHERRTYWDRVALLIVLLIIIAIAGWWLESRFGANWAAGAFGILAGVVVFAWGGGFAWAIMRGTLGASAQFNSDLASVEEKRQAVHKEYAKLDFIRARAELDYDRDVRRVADQRSRLLLDAQRQADAQRYRIVGEMEEAQPPRQIDGEWQEYD